MSLRRPSLDEFPYFKDGMDISDKIQKEYLKPGCRSPDCIKSIDNPIWLTKNEFFNMWDNNQRVLALLDINNNKVSNIFVVPITVLDYHEIINFEFPSEIPVAITYCPLCQTATGYDRRVNGQTIELGVSGLLYQSALIMYDRVSNSLFSQVFSHGIHGKFKDQKLTKLPLLQTRIKELNEIDIENKFFGLSRDTGYPRHMEKYGSKNYGDYRSTKKVMFPTREFDDKLHPKTICYDIHVGNKAYIVERNKLSEGKITDEIYVKEFNGGYLFFSQPQSDELNMDYLLDSTIAYYFTCKSYYPDAELLNLS